MRSHTTIDGLIYRAFNATSELASCSALGWLSSGSGSGSGDGLSAAERIADDSKIRFLLEREMNNLEFRILQLYYTSTRDIDYCRHIFHPLRKTVIKAAKLASTVEGEFVDIVALSEFWDYNLLRKGLSGTLADYGNQFTNCRRRKKLVSVIRAFRVQSMKRATDIINQSSMCDDEKMAADAH